MTIEASPPRVLIVEDEEPILDGLCALFDSAGFRADRAPDGQRALAALSTTRYDLVVLDLMIPEPNGLGVLTWLRERADQTPVLVLTARDAEDDIVAGLSAGADDYVTKPFGIKELVARARGLLRRARAPEQKPRRITWGAAVIDLERLRVDAGTYTVQLSAREADLLEYLLAHRDRTVPRAELLVHVWGYREGSTIRTRTVDVHVQQLRSKLRSIPGAEGWIDTIRGRGYRFAGELP